MILRNQAYVSIRKDRVEFNDVQRIKANDEKEIWKIYANLAI